MLFQCLKEYPQLDAFKGQGVLVTGGMGFIGSTLVKQLLFLGARVTVVDVMDPGGGANSANLDCHLPGLTLIQGDIQDPVLMEPLLTTHAYLFSLAAQTSHLGSMDYPLIDFEINARGHLMILELCRHKNPHMRMVYASTRQVYGWPTFVPVDETHPVQPVDVNGISKQTAENFHLLYHRVYGMKASILRLTNTYGPGMRIKDARQTFLGLWVRLLLEGKEMEVWGGQQRRDFTYGSDAALAFLLSAVSPQAVGQVYNVGGCPPHSLEELAQKLIHAHGGKGAYELKAYPAHRQAIEIGDIYSNDKKLRQETGWKTHVSLEEGLAQTLAYYTQFYSEYE